MNRENYIPKNERKTILFLSDDLRVPSGVGVMSKEIVEGTCHIFNWIQLGAAVNHPELGKVLDISNDVASATGVEDAFVRVIPYNGYGDAQILRRILAADSPDAILHFTDPRYWIWLYQLEHEIRQRIPILYYNIWDDLPPPKYNRKFYQSCDAIFAISKLTYNVNKQVLGEDNVTVLDFNEVANELS